jgi:GNAT superfamily N-acetyltransferase
VLIEPNPALSLCFVHPEFQRKGIGSLLLQLGIEKAEEVQAKIWLTSTPQAMPTYQRNGWEVKQIQKIDLVKHGGKGTYNRAWMLRLPGQTMHEMA